MRLSAPAVALLAALAPASAGASGEVSGTVLLSRPAPKLPALKVNVSCAAGHGDAPPNEALLAQEKTGALANVVVSLKGIAVDAPPPATAGAVLDQVGCVYRPHVQAVTVGTQVSLLNSDAVLHNVRGTQGAVQVFNVAMPLRGRPLPTRLTRPGPVRLECNAGHPWMNAWIYVFEHPFFAVTGADGRFVIKDVPAGRYTVEYWHEPVDGRGPGVTRTAEVTVREGAATRADAKLDL